MKQKSSYVNLKTGQVEEAEVDCFDEEDEFKGIDIDDDDEDWFEGDDDDDSVGVARLLLILFAVSVAIIGLFCIFSKNDD